MQRSRILRAALLAALTAFTLLPGRLSSAREAAVPQEHDDSDDSLIASLDSRIQERFKDVDESFGFRRIVTPGMNPHRFTPENARELKIVKDLERSRLEIALYLAGRSVLGPKPDEAAWRKKDSRLLIKGPALVSANDSRRGDLPAPSELWEQSRRAMEVLQKSSAYDFALGGWKFSARPVRASDQSCLKCHSSDRASTILLTPGEGVKSSVKIGDLLGIVLYASDRARRR